MLRAGGTPTDTLVNSLPLLRVSQLIHVVGAADSMGVPVGSVLRKLGQPSWDQCDPNGLTAITHFFSFMDRAAHLAGSETFGAQVIEQSPFNRIGKLGQAISNAPNIYQALQTATRLLPAHTNFKRYWLAERDDQIWFCRGSPTILDVGEEICCQFALTGMVQIVQMGTGTNWRPNSAVLQGDGIDTLANTELFSQADIRSHRSISAFAIPKHLLALPIEPARTAGKLPATAAIDDADILASAPAKELVGSLKQLIGTLLMEGCPRLETIAEILNMHPRSLQRLLRRKNVTHQQLVDEVRAEAASRLLGNPDGSITDIALDLGYADVAHFTRAFRRWAGVSPTQFRSQRLAA